MMTLHNLLPIAAGMMATLVMTLFTRIVFALMNRPYHLLKVLGNMLLFQYHTVARQPPPPAAARTASILHYLIGILFAYVYHWLVVGDNVPHLVETLIYGIIISLTAVAGWRLFFVLHPGPPNITLTSYLIVVGIGHWILAAALYGIYSGLT